MSTNTEGTGDSSNLQTSEDNKNIFQKYQEWIKEADYESVKFWYRSELEKYEGTPEYQQHLEEAVIKWNEIKEYGMDIAMGTSGGIKLVKGAAGVANLGKAYGKFGTIVENPGIKITGFSGHSVNQAITREVSTEVIQNTVKNPIAVLSQRSGNSFAYVSNEAVVVVDKAGEIITTYGKNNFDAIVQQVLKETIK